MRDIDLEEGGVVLYRNNDEKIDPDKDFSHIDKRIEDVLGYCQKYFMGEVTAANLGSKWGVYGSFLPVERNSRNMTCTRPQRQSSSRSPHNPTTEVHQNPTIQANGLMPFRLQPGIPPVSGQAISALKNAVDVRSSGEAFCKNQPKTIPANHSDNNLLKAWQKLGSDCVVDNSVIYSGLGLDISPSSSHGDSPFELDGTSPCMHELPEKSPSFIIEAMTSLPFPDGKLHSPLSDNLVFLMEKAINLERTLPCLETSVKIEDESISSEGKLTLQEVREVKQINKSKKASEFERKNFEEPSNIFGHCMKRMEESKISKGKEIILESPSSAVDMHFDKKDTSFIMRKDNISRISLPFNERNKVGHLGDAGIKLQKQSHVRQGTSFEQVDSLPSSVASFEEKGNPLEPPEKIQRGKNVDSVMRSDAGNDELCQTGSEDQYIKKPKKSKEQKIKTKVKEEFQNSLLSQDASMQHEKRRREDANKSTKRHSKMKNKVKKLPDSALQEAGTYHERTADKSMEKIHNDRKASFVVDKDVKDKKQHKFEDCDIFQGTKVLDDSTGESLKESSSENNIPHSQMGANLPDRKECLSSDDKRKRRKSQDGSQLAAALPKVSFRVGSSALFSQQTDSGSNFLAQDEIQRELSKVKDKNSDLAGKAALKKKGKIIAAKGTVVGAKRGKDALGSILKDKSDGKQSQYPSSAGSNPREYLGNNSYLMQKAPTSGALPTEIAPVLIQDNWVECDKCHTWRLLPHYIKPDDLPKSWTCKMLTWLPGMNKCSFTQEATETALLALYQLPPLVNDTQIHQAYPNGGPPVVVAADTKPVGITNSVTGLDAVPGSGKRRPSQDVYANSKKDQQYTVESGKKGILSQSRAGAHQPMVKREGSKDKHGVLKKLKRGARQFATDVNPVVPLAAEIGNAGLNHDIFSSEVSKALMTENSNISSKKFKDKTQKPSSTNKDERKDMPAKKRKLKDWLNDPVGTETPSCQVPLKESSHELKKEKRQKMELQFYKKESSTTRATDKNHGGRQDSVSCGGSLAKAGRRGERPSEQHHDRNMSYKAIDGKKSSTSHPELKMPDLATATSSSSKVSSTCRVKVKSQAKCSPVGSISSSPLSVSRSDHDKSRNQISTLNTDKNLSLVKKTNQEARVVAPDFVSHHEERTDGKSKKETVPEVQFHPVEEDAVRKRSAVKHVDEHRREKQPKFEAYESKQSSTEFKEDETSSCLKLALTDQGARSLNVLVLDKANSENIAPERVKPKRDQAGSSRDNPTSSTQELESEKGYGWNAMVAHDSKEKFPKQPGCTELLADDARASSSVRKDNTDRAARMAIREAKDLKHSADRLKNSGSGLSTEVFFQAALKFLHGASLLESDNTEGSRCGDMKSSEVYSSTAKLCLYCAHEFEKSNDMASATLAYKCMEVAYMHVVYADDVAASRDRHELQLVQTAVPQVESPSSSASDVDNANNPTPNDAVRASHSSAVHGNYVISAGNRPSFIRLLSFAQDVNLAMDAARKSQTAFAAARLILGDAGNEEAISSIKRVLDFNFHDVKELLHLVRLAIEAFNG